MINLRRNHLGVLDRWMGRSFRVTAKEAALFLLTVVILATAYPSEKSILIGSGIITVGLILRSWAAGYERVGILISGPYLFVRYPHHLGTVIWLVGIAVIGRQLDIVLLSCVLSAVFLTWEIRHWDARDTRLLGHSFLLYQKIVPGMFPSLMPLKLDFLKREFGFLGVELPFSLKRSIFEGQRGNDGEIITIFYTFIILIVYFLILRFDGIIPVRQLFLGGCFSFLVVRFIFFAVRGERRLQMRSDSGIKGKFEK